MYIKNNKMNVEVLGRGNAWFDVGTFNTLLEAGEYVQSLENRQGLKISCPEEIAYKLNRINKKEFSEIISKMPQNEYSNYLKLIFKNS